MDAVEEGGVVVRRETEELQKELAEMRRKVGELEKMVAGRGGWGGGVRGRGKRRCMVLMDSNGRGVMPDTIGDLLGGEERERWEIQVQVFTLREAWDRLGREDIRLDEFKVVVDCITNEVRGTRLQGWVELEEVVERLRRSIGDMGGVEGIVVCEVKPKQHIDVVPFNTRIHCLSLYMEWVEGYSK